MKQYYCTYFDKNYLVKALAMMQSLQKNSRVEVQILAVCHDELSRILLNALQLPGVIALGMHEIERDDKDLLAAKHTRQLVEYFWTCTPTIILRLLERNPHIEQITYLDADLYFYANPEPVFKEMGSASVLIHEHRFSPELAYLQPQAGRFNVGLLSFKQNNEAYQVLKWWRARCNEWCFMHYEDGKMGDQLYLDQWPKLFPQVKILQHIGAGVAPWNHQQYHIASQDQHIKVNQNDLIFYHFHAFSRLGEYCYAPLKHPHYPVTVNVLKEVFVPYIEAIEQALIQVKTLSPQFKFGMEEAENARPECVLIAKKALAASRVWQPLLADWLVSMSQVKLQPPPADEALLNLNSGELLLDYIARPQIAAQIKHIYFIGCHYFEEREWFFNTFPHLEKIYLFEPLPQVYATLVQYFSHDSRIQIFPYAISEQDGKAKFNVTNNLQSSSLLDLKLHKDIFPYVEKSNEVEVVVRSLDSVVKEFNLPLPDLLYIDVQGAEYQALQGALEWVLPHTSVVFTEASTIEMYAGAHTLNEVDVLLAGQHFKLLGFKDMLGTRVHGDALFIGPKIYAANTHPEILQAQQLNVKAQQALLRNDLVSAQAALLAAAEPPLALTQLNMARLALAAGDQGLAQELLRQAYQLAPNDRAILLVWVSITGAALPACQEFVLQHPTDTAFADQVLECVKQHPAVPASRPVQTISSAISAPIFYWQETKWSSRLQNIFVFGALSQAEWTVLSASFTVTAQINLFIDQHKSLPQWTADARLAVYHTQENLNTLCKRFAAPDLLYFLSAADAAAALLALESLSLFDVSMIVVAELDEALIQVLVDYLICQQFTRHASYQGDLNLVLFVNQRAEATLTLQRAKAQLLNIEAGECLTLGHMPEACDLLDQALSLDAGLASTYLSWGRYCELANQPQAALESYLHAFTLDERSEHAARVLANLLRKMGNNAEAAGVLQHFQASTPAKLSRKPRISALVSTYNSAEFIAECLDDLLAQTVADQIEIIVIDANSPQNEGEIVAAYQAKHSNIRYIRTPERIGIYPAWNLAIGMAEGEYLISASTNDRLRFDSCERLMQELDADSQLALVYGDSYLTTIAHQQFGTAVIQAVQAWPPYSFEVHLHNCLVGCHPMWRKSMHDEFGLFDENFVAIGDQDMWLRMAEKYPLKHIDFVTGLFWSATDSLSGNTDVALPEIAKVQQHYQERYAYHQYLKQSALNQAELTLYGERINAAKYHLGVHLFILDEKGDLAAVAHTINSITKQYYQGALQLTIVSILPPPTTGSEDRVRYLQYKTQPWCEINQLIGNTEGDCFGVVRAGDELAIHSLLLMLDAFITKKKVKLVYANEDLREKSGIYSQPVLYKEKTVPQILEQGFVSFSLLDRKAFLELGGFRQDVGAESLLDYAKRLFLHDKTVAFAHIDAVLYHAKNQKRASYIFEKKGHAVESIASALLAEQGFLASSEQNATPKTMTIEYREWLEQQKFTRAQASLIDAYFAQHGEPSLCIYIIDRAGDLAAVVKTIQSITNQLYRNIEIVIVSSLSRQDSGGIRWLKATQHHYPLALHHASLQEADCLGLLEAGDLLLQNGALLAMQKIVANPEWQLVYCDDDILNGNQEPDHPRFKPDFNLDLARSIPYADGFILLRTTALPNIRPDFFEAAEQVDIIFSIFDEFGTASIGHIAEVVCHLQLNWSRALDNPQRKLSFTQAVEAHLLRGKVGATILPGLVEGSQRLVYQHTEQPLVSIIIPTKDQLPMLQRCIESLLEKTEYPYYELIIVDNQSETAEAKNYLAQLAALGEDKIRILSYPKPFNYSAINNMAAKEARGDYLVLLNNDTAILQDNWLDELLHHAQRPEVGIVGAKLLFPNGTVQHAGVVLGLRGAAGHPGIDSAFDWSGYMHRLQLDQNYSAVTAACLMVRKSVFFQVEGLDEQYFKVSYNDIDLCLKVRSLGYLIVWTPYSMVMHEANVSLVNIDSDKTADKVIRHDKEQLAMYKKWFSIIENDPAYNKNCTLSGLGFEMERRAALTWKPLSWRPLPSVFCHPGDQMGCGQYRILQPFSALEEAQKITGGIAFELLPDFESIKLAPDVMVFQRQITEQQLEFLQRYKLALPSYKVYELDDYLPNVPMKSAHRSHMPKDVTKSLRKALTFVDRFVVSTDELANAYQGMHPVIYVVNNYLPVSIWGDLQSVRRVGKKPRVGWAGGISHTGDLELISGVVQALADEVEWVFFGMCPDKLRPFVHEFHEGIAIELYPAKLASLNLDLALAPLEHNTFNLCKSNLRLLEYGACGFPVICTDIAPYQCDLPVTRVKNRHKDWVDAIRDHLLDLDSAAAKGDALKAGVLKDWMLKGVNLDKWRDAWLPN